jgi:cytochrome c oxidase subunit 3
MEQQKESAKLGMWVFLVTEVLLFGGLFVAYSIYRAWNPDLFFNAHTHLSLLSGTTNTVVLITSSVTVALAIHYIRLNNKKAALINLSITLALAAVFLVIKYFEYAHKFHLGQLPGKYYTYTGIEGSNPHVFFSIYFLMTGLHGFHVLCGIGVIGWMIKRTARGDFSPEYYTPIEMTGLYWHLVDMIWIFLFPLFYLVG